MSANKHEHYDLIVQWASDPSQKVWFLSDAGWKEAPTPSWSPVINYHIGELPPPPKRKIMIGGVEIDAPETTPLTGCLKEYYIPAIAKSQLYVMYRWVNSISDLLLIERGLVHLNKEAAIAHARALIKFTTISLD